MPSRGLLDPQLSDDDELLMDELSSSQGNGDSSKPHRTRSSAYNGFNSFARQPRRGSLVEEEEKDTIEWNVYEDFTTIDWLRDANVERQRQKQLHKRANQSAWGWAVKRFGDSWQGWIVSFLVGVFTALVAVVIDIGTDWLSDIKMGICPSKFWLNQNNCCYLESTNDCDNWYTWQKISHSSHGTIRYLVGYIVYVAIGVSLAVASAVLVDQFAPYAAGSGIAEVKTILSGFVIKKFLSLRTLVVKIFGLILSVASGLSLGKEGPMVHVAACVGNIMCGLFTKYRYNEAKKREIMSAAVAAGVSVAFGSPIGGVLFSLEEASYYFPHKTMWRAFFCALVAAGTVQYFDPFKTGRLVLFYAQYDHPWHMLEMPAFIFLGVAGGLYGAFMVRANIWWLAFKKKIRVLREHPIAEVALVAIVTVLFKYPIMYLRISTSDMIHMMFSECKPDSRDYLCMNEDSIFHTYGLLIISTIFTVIITVFTFGLKVPSGVFIPPIAVGAMIGRMVGMVTRHIVIKYGNNAVVADMCGYKIETCVTPGLYAMVGAAAALGGVTRMTVALVVIMFELTGDVNYIVPIMVACLLSKWVGDALGTDGIYEEQIRLKGYPYLDSKEDYQSQPAIQTVVSVMRPREGDELLCVLEEHGNTLGSLEALLAHTTFRGFPLIHSYDDRRIVGFVNRSDLARAISKAEASGMNEDTRCVFAVSADTHTVGPVLDMRNCLDQTPLQVDADMPIEIVYDLFRKIGLRYLLVTKDAELVGVITKKDLLSHHAANAELPRNIRSFMY